jgi:DNA replication and repair protein RecF
MILTSFLVRNFRNIQEANLALSRGIHLFSGANAQGKTALVEAILFLATSTSHRTRREEELIRWGEEVAFLRGVIQHGEESESIECGLEKRKKIIKIDKRTLPRVGDLYGHLRTVLFAPEDLQIIAGSPQERRRFLDMAIAQIDSAYIPLLQQFRRALNQRNRILKRLQLTKNAEGMRELGIWDHTFLDYSTQVTRRRCEMTQVLAPLVRSFYESLAEEGPFSMKYSGGDEADEFIIRERLQNRLERIRQSEIERGASLLGPHRDDLQFILADKNVSVFASQGQRRTTALALRLAEAKLSFEKTGARPLLLIDDVIYEMDNTRRGRFWEQVDQSGPLIVTATSREQLGPGLQLTSIFQVHNGEIHSS